MIFPTSLELTRVKKVTYIQQCPDRNKKGIYMYMYITYYMYTIHYMDIIHAIEKLAAVGFILYQCITTNTNRKQLFSFYRDFPL